MNPDLAVHALLAVFALNLLQCTPVVVHLRTVACLSFGLTAYAFLTLVLAHATSDFSLVNVYLNSHTLKPLLYKITGSWGNHEGSFLLWLLLLTAYATVFALICKKDGTSRLALRVQGGIIAGMAAFIVWTSNPFARLIPAPAEGRGLNPLLQDIGLALHPPLLYLGYAGSAVIFALAVAGLWYRSVGREWSERVRPWLLFSFGALTLGVTLGSWWAYRELGWGGFWFWDPVENVSLLPWLAGLALMHTLLALRRHEGLARWSALLAILMFALSMIGMFLVRSGILVSVHSFAEDPGRGIGILTLFGVIVGSALTLYAFRAHTLASPPPLPFRSREGGILLQTLLLVIACGTILLGTIYPILLQVVEAESVSVGAPYFHRTVLPLMLPILLLTLLGPSLRWEVSAWRVIGAMLLWPGIVGVLTLAAAYALFPAEEGSGMAWVGLGASVSLVVGMLLLLARRAQLGRKPWRESVATLRSLSAKFYGMWTAHTGAGLLAFGIACSALWSAEITERLAEGEAVAFAGEHWTFTGSDYNHGKNFFRRTATLVTDAGLTLRPELRLYPVEGTETTEAAVDYGLFRNRYAAFGKAETDTAIVVRLYVHAGVVSVWLGAALMALGALIALFRRKKT